MPVTVPLPSTAYCNFDSVTCVAIRGPTLKENRISAVPSPGEGKESKPIARRRARDHTARNSERTLGC